MLQIFQTKSLLNSLLPNQGIQIPVDLLCKPKIFGKILDFFSELPNPRSTSGETIQNSLTYWNWKQGLLIWSIVERINFMFKWNSRSMYIYIQKACKLYFKNN